MSGAFRVGQIVGGHVILGDLGVGGMGMVARARHVRLDRDVAIKVLRPEYAGQPEIVERFLNEARAMQAIRHPAIVEIYDSGYVGDGHPYIVMELLEGENLADRLRRERRLPLAVALRLAAAIARALAAAHARGVVHRDLKPDNVFLVPGDAAIKLLDFGIARLDGTARDVRQTAAGVMLGTPLYMSPEQCRDAGGCDHRTDLYALGCVLFEMISGRAPFLASTAIELMAAHLQTPPPALEAVAPWVAPEIAALVASLLAKDPDGRPSDAASVAIALAGYAAAAPPAEPSAPPLRARGTLTPHLPRAGATVAQGSLPPLREAVDTHACVRTTVDGEMLARR
jgi:eukaryotic-like serine/threonine-protein kinase